MSPRELSESERADWLRLSRTQNVGPVAFRDLLRRFGSARAALEALPDLVRGRTLTSPSAASIAREMDAMQSAGVRLIAACEADYPDLLRHTDPPPPLIQVRGRLEVLHRPTIAMVGSRNASAIGRKLAAHLATGLGAAGYTVVSGLARGVDAAAHRAALPTGTAAVLGGGIDHIYPRDNAELYHAIAADGALISESPLGYTAQARDFPRRNRIVSGLSRGVVVVEAAERSGTLITARYALEQNREVMACPGSPLDPRTKGCNRLIRQGAHLVEDVDDILAVLDTSARTLFEDGEDYAATPFDWDAASGLIESARQELLALASPTPTPRDDLMREAGLTAAVANAALLELELSGEIVVEPDGRVALSVL